MMSVGLHCRLVGRPGRAAALKRFIDYVKGHDKVWLPRRIDIARTGANAPPLPAAGAAALAHGREASSKNSAASSSIRHGSPNAPSSLELGPAHDSAGGLHNALAASSARRRRRRAARRAERPIPTSPASWRRRSG
jgi:hypothetical protein